MFVFFSSEFKWIQLVAGNRFLHYDSIGEAGVLDEDDELISGSGMGRLYKMSLKWFEWEKKVKKQKNFKGHFR